MRSKVISFAIIIWLECEAGSQQKTGTSSTSCEQQSSHTVGGLCICTLIYLRCEQSLTWVASAETSLTGGFSERCLPDELSLL